MLPEIPFDLHRAWMEEAIALAKQAGASGEIPVGAVIVDSSNRVIGVGENRKERDRNPVAHAEIIAIQAATQTLQDWHLTTCRLYVTLEPCPMCAGAIIQARVGTLIYGVDDSKTGAIRSVINLPDSAASFHRLQVLSGIGESACQDLLQDWFQQHRRRDSS